MREGSENESREKEVKASGSLMKNNEKGI